MSSLTSGYSRPGHQKIMSGQMENGIVSTNINSDEEPLSGILSRDEN